MPHVYRIVLHDVQPDQRAVIRHILRIQNAHVLRHNRTARDIGISLTAAPRQLHELDARNRDVNDPERARGRLRARHPGSSRLGSVCGLAGTADEGRHTTPPPSVARLIVITRCAFLPCAPPPADTSRVPAGARWYSTVAQRDGVEDRG